MAGTVKKWSKGDYVWFYTGVLVLILLPIYATSFFVPALIGFDHGLYFIMILTLMLSIGIAQWLHTYRLFHTKPRSWLRIILTFMFAIHLYWLLPDTVQELHRRMSRSGAQDV